MKYSINFHSTGIPYGKRAVKISEAGFEAVFINWYYDKHENYNMIDICRKNDLFIETAHTMFDQVNSIWLDNLDGDEYRNYLKNSVKEAENLEIPVLIVHLSSGDDPPEVNSRGLSFLFRLIEQAYNSGVTLAFENLRKTSYLDELFSYKDAGPAGFCFDCGHENLYNNGSGVLEKYGSRLAALHLHDNHSIGDDHLLPFDGDIDWQAISERLKKYKNKIILTAEAYDILGGNIRYRESEFYKNAFERLDRINNLINEGGV